MDDLARQADEEDDERLKGVAHGERLASGAPAEADGSAPAEAGGRAPAEAGGSAPAEAGGRAPAEAGGRAPAAGGQPEAAEQEEEADWVGDREEEERQIEAARQAQTASAAESAAETPPDTLALAPSRPPGAGLQPFVKLLVAVRNAMDRMPQVAGGMASLEAHRQEVAGELSWWEQCWQNALRMILSPASAASLTALRLVACCSSPGAGVVVLVLDRWWQSPMNGVGCY